MFTAEAAYVIVIVFAAVLIFLASLPQATVPNYDVPQTMKVAHDMGEARTTSPPTGYAVTGCDNKTTVNLTYYDVGVCMK